MTLPSPAQFRAARAMLDWSRIELARSTGEEARLRYGWCGDSVKGLGNLRDSAGETIFYQADGYSLPLHNWAPIFELFLN